MAEANELITAEELAERLRVRPDTIKQWTRQGKIPSVRIGRKVIRYDVAEVVRALRGDSRVEALQKLADELDAHGYSELADQARKLSRRRGGQS